MANVTMKDVAQKAGVSVSTVSHVVNNTRFVDAATREKVESAMKALAYVPNFLARSLRKKTTHTIGIIVSDIGNSFFTDIVKACEDEAYKLGYNTILCNSEENPEKEKMYLNILQQKQVDGIIMAPTGSNLELIEEIHINTPIVFVDRDIASLNIDYVGIKNFEAAYEAMEHLKGLGHKRIALLYSYEHISSTQERMQGYHQAVKDFNLDNDGNLLIKVKASSKTHESRKYIKAYLENNERPDCILVINNMLTIELISVLKELGLATPKDVAVFGITDFFWCWAFEPALSMVHVSQNDLGMHAVDLLIQNIDGKKEKVLKERIDFMLVIRDSCGAMKGPVRVIE